MKLPTRLWIALPLLLALAAAAYWLRPAASPIRIGVLHSLTGTMADNELPIVDVIRLAVEELNASGGLLGRPVEIELADGQSDAARFAREAERLITDRQVSALFACWTSTCRKAVKPVIEQHRHLMFYPLQYEGLEQSPNIYYAGAAPNQQIIPGTRWALERLGKRAYLLGSDYIFPRTANLIIRDIVQANQGSVLAERYQPLGAQNFDRIIAELRRLKPEVIFNTINGDSNAHFFRALRQAGLTNLPVVSFSVDETGLQNMGTGAYHPNHYAVWNYFQSMPSLANQRFVSAYRTRFGRQRVTSAPAATAYTMVHLWAQAVRDAGTDDPQQVNITMLQQSYASPFGIAAVDRATRHLWQPASIGKARRDFQFDLVWSSDDIIQPIPFPDYRPRAEWQRIQGKLSGGPH
ncbi:MAG TPA: urea ABC transporter substrate-binding protein [Gallionellaceae bacterium]|nr:urea ABC transporter substrate-binding protein [Gallionellaceae bacterium]